ncbi:MULTISPECIES: RNA 2',3'-cyclic phosphodiesterase [Methylobacterium]|uniref:RNA 2',3'-cyclic phosphodiesterase n=1 Tax=Methylobacterium TaxID=407 RepID=UPI00034AE055|nr:MULTISPECIES: RNA 2',3'-cyclic phosphodiesterase [Methylobacterium]MBN4094501.1 RNA 2',3'-cyclic phosphodiesterase [Methylobacterium sp. OT2]UIN33085.1 RNA 2',3'-cyclic phosphodiesterase [Methylobacterium oryzae]SEG59843.1 2'-5' RNA ligase [Methylobacterium sp. 190mf]SEI13582.1 2'-5' RNA ligase [Methylobacterium sp. 275MFSha3.1]
MPRLFTGLAVPPAIADALRAWQGGLPGARWIEPGDFHVTLRFIGDVDATTADDVVEALSEMRVRPALTVTLDGLGIFGGDRPRALYASVVPEAELTDLQAEQERLVRRAGVEPERRKFTPHVTLARLRRDATPEAAAMYLSQAPVFAPLTYTSDRVTLFSARDSTGGGPYVAEAEFPFA